MPANLWNIVWALLAVILIIYLLKVLVGVL